ncbi:DUF2029 domain-containing protein, partial [bacterium]
MPSDISLQTVGVVLAVSTSNLAVLAWWRGWPKSLGRVKSWITRSLPRSAVFLASMLAAIWVAIFLVYGYPVTGDIKLYFQPYGRAVLAGAIPNVDFRSSYMPLFPYLMGAVDAIWSSDLSIPLFFTGCFALACILLGKGMVEGGATVERAGSLAIIGALNGASWFLAVGYQQDESVMLLLAVMAMVFILRRRDLTGGVVLGLGLLATKVTFGISAVALLSQSRRRRQLVMGATLAAAPCILLFALLGFNPLLMISGETGRINPPSLTALLGSLPFVYGSISPSLWAVHLLAGAWCLTMAAMFRKPRLPEVSFDGLVKTL